MYHAPFSSSFEKNYERTVPKKIPIYGRMLWNIVILCSVWSMRYIDRVTAVTTIRLWHELHVAKHIPHDFISLLKPEQEAMYVGIIRHDEIRALAMCKQCGFGIMEVYNIAYAPYEHAASCALIHMTHKLNMTVNDDMLYSQPRLFFESIIVRTSGDEILS